jgi:HAD superfamily hydrolase (TIGR01509 family)
MYKLVIFDLDGVLYDSKKFHYEALNFALKEVSEDLPISFDEHTNIYDGLTTTNKLKILTEKKGLNKSEYQKIWETKQIETLSLLDQIKPDDHLISILKNLKKQNIALACASNSIKNTVHKVLSNLEILDLFDTIISNEEVLNAKPHPEMYWKTIIENNVLPSETLIIEDSPIGRRAAMMSGANYYFVNNSKEVDNKLLEFILNKKKSSGVNLETYKNNKLKVLIPMAGKGSRFAEKGYVFPKPLIEIKNKPMIQVVVDNINIDCEYIFIVQKEHVEQYNIDKMLKIIKPDCKIVAIDEVTEGAACTTLLAENYIDSEGPLIIANSDQFILWNPNEVIYNFINKDVDGGILTFNSTHPKWSYAKTDENGSVTEVAEKNPISTNATVGIYYWKSGSDYVKYAKEMINKNIRVNNEFYVCPVYNEAIKDNQKIITHEIEKMWGIGTPEDLDSFLEDYKSNL